MNIKHVFLLHVVRFLSEKMVAIEMFNKNA